MLGRLVTLHRSTDSGTTYGAAFGAVQDLQIGERTAETQESTYYGADHDYKEFDYGLKDGGEWTVTIRYQAGQTDAVALEDAFENSTFEYIQAQFPAPISKGKNIKCLVTKVGSPTPRGEHVDRVFTLKVTGKPGEVNL